MKINKALKSTLKVAKYENLKKWKLAKNSKQNVINKTLPTRLATKVSIVGYHNNMRSYRIL